MDESMASIIYNTMTEEYVDDIEENKSLKQYLLENTEEELLHIYMLYSYTKDTGIDYNKIAELENKDKEIIVDELISLLDEVFNNLIRYLKKNDLEHIVKLCEYDIYIFKPYDDNILSLNMIKMFKELGLIYCKKDIDNLIIHMPKEIKDKFQKTVVPKVETFDDVNEYIVGLVNTYGFVHLDKAYDVIKNEIKVTKEKFKSIIEFNSILEIYDYSYSYEYDCIHSMELTENDLNDFTKEVKDFFIYSPSTYKSMGDNTYIENLAEFKEFANYLKKFYSLDIRKPESEIIRDGLIFSYLSSFQADPYTSLENLHSTIDEYFDIPDDAKEIIVGYVKSISEKMPVWKSGGKIKIDEKSEKVGRNSLCPCGSGKKYKHCCGKNV